MLKVLLRVHGEEKRPGEIQNVPFFTEPTVNKLIYLLNGGSGAFSIELKDIYLNRAKRVQSHRTLDVTVDAKSAVQNQSGFIIHLLRLRSRFFLHRQAEPGPEHFLHLADGGYIHSAWEPKKWRSPAVVPSPAMSGHQTQTRDLCREEGVQDEDDGLRTRVEVQLLEERKEEILEPSDAQRV